LKAHIGAIVDHINHDKLDNRKSNLRLCNQSENMANQIKRISNTSGYKGVYWSTEKNKWYVKIGVKNKNIHIGYYENFEDAIIERIKAEDEYHGDFRYTSETQE
jgi:hypothetical protein